MLNKLFTALLVVSFAFMITVGALVYAQDNATVNDTTNMTTNTTTNTTDELPSGAPRTGFGG